MKNKFSAILIDDEPLSLSLTSAYLKPFPEVEVIGTFTKSKIAREEILIHKPDLLFLDIQMPEMNGFELIESIVHLHNPYIIFTTAFEQYALKAFEVNAIGYLLKPFDKEKFGHAVHKFLSFQQNRNESELLSGIEKLLSLQPAAPRLDRIMVRDTKKIIFVPVHEIIYFEAAGDYVKVFTSHRNHLISDSLQALEKKLSPELFIRIHRSHIVNILEVKAFIPHLNGEYLVSVSNGSTLKMSRNYREPVSQLFRGL